MRKPTIYIGENKAADQLRSNCEADHAFVFATRIVQFLSYLNPKFQASSSFLCLYRLVCVRPVQKPHCWFSHEVAHISMYILTFQSTVLLKFTKLHDFSLAYFVRFKGSKISIMISIIYLS